MTNDELKAMLTDIKNQLIAVYPLRDPCDVDPRLALAVGMMIALSMEALASEHEDRDFQFFGMHFDKALMNRLMEGKTQ